MAAVTLDAHGNPTAGPPEAVAHYDDALDRLLRLSTEVVPAASALVREWPEVPMAQALWAYLMLSSTDAADIDAARRSVDDLGRLARRRGPREGAHHRALDAWASGDWPAAATVLDELLLEWPVDLLALMMGHQLDFYVGDAGNLRDRVGRSLGAVDPAHPHRGLVEGMYAFGLEESGHYERAEECGRAAVERNPDDVWAIHAVAHTHEMRGRVDTGLVFLDERAADWEEGNLLAVHLAWHRALFLLEAGRVDDVLRTYDRWAYSAQAPAPPLQLLDASALLWRLLLDGVDVGDRFGHLADAWAAALERSGGPGGPRASWYPFNDAHAVMAFAGAERFDQARAVVDRLAVDAAPAGAAAHAGAGAPSRVVMAATALPAGRAVLAFAEGRHEDVVADLTAVRRTLHRFGGSHAQRDAFERTLLESALASGRLGLARALVSERLAARPASAYARRRRDDLAARLAG
jgi:tetratricopeptide (TPR) repeat protein